MGLKTRFKVTSLLLVVLLGSLCWPSSVLAVPYGADCYGKSCPPSGISFWEQYGWLIFFALLAIIAGLLFLLLLRRRRKRADANRHQVIHPTA